MAANDKAIARARLFFLKWTHDAWEAALDGADEVRARSVVERIEKQWLALHGADLPEAVRRRMLAYLTVQARRALPDARRAGEAWNASAGIAFMRQTVGYIDPGALDGVGDSAISAAITSKTIADGVMGLWKAAGVPGSADLVDKYTRDIDSDDGD